MKRTAIFFTCLAVFAGLAWLGGYNFDTRSERVAVYALGSLGMSALITALWEILK